MTEHILLMNPRRKGRMPPALARYWASRRGKGRTHASNPRKRRRINPRPYRVRHAVAGHFARSAMAAGRRVWVRRHMSNPRGSIREHMAGLQGLIMPTVAGAVGGIALDFAWTKLSPKLPTTFQTGWGAFAGEAVAAVALGWGLGKVMPRQRKEIMAGVVGALVIITYQAIQPMLASSLGIAGVGDYTAYNTGGRVGAYMPAGNPQFALPAPVRVAGLGITTPASVVQDATAALRGNMGPGVGGVAGYMPDTMQG